MSRTSGRIASWPRFLLDEAFGSEMLVALGVEVVIGVAVRRLGTWRCWRGLGRYLLERAIWACGLLLRGLATRRRDNGNGRGRAWHHRRRLHDRSGRGPGLRGGYPGDGARLCLTRVAQLAQDRGSPDDAVTHLSHP